MTSMSEETVILDNIVWEKKCQSWRNQNLFLVLQGHHIPLTSNSQEIKIEVRYDSKIKAS